MKKSKELLSMLVCALLLTGCSNTTNSDSSEATSVTEVTESVVEVVKTDEVAESAIANIEDTIIGEEAGNLGLEDGVVIGTDAESDSMQVTGVSFYGVNGISEFSKDSEGKIVSYTFYAQDISNDFENLVDKAVKGVENETGEKAQYEEQEVNEGKNGATTLEALKNNNLYCYYKFNKEGTYIQIMGNNAGGISMLISINNEKVESEVVEITADAANEGKVEEAQNITEEQGKESEEIING